MRPSWDVVWLSDIPWGSLWQRPQQLATRFPDDARILFVEPWTLGHRAAVTPVAVTERIVRVSFPFLPLHARSMSLRRLAYRLGDQALTVSAILAVQRGWARALPRFGRPGARRLALVQNFLGGHLLPVWRPDRVVYDMIDAPLHFAPVPPRLVAHWERLVRGADRIAVTSAPLAALARSAGAPREPRIIGNGVEASRFASAAPDAASLPGAGGGPVIGYVGALHAWFDVPLVAALARALPNAHVLLVGPAHPAVAAELERASEHASNLHWIGPRPYGAIPGIVRGFRVGLIPFRRTPLTEAVNPVKLYEYAAAGVPCVATRFTDAVEEWRDAARIADTPEAFIDETRAAMERAPDSEGLRAFARRHDWKEIARDFVAYCFEDAA